MDVATLSQQIQAALYQSGDADVQHQRTLDVVLQALQHALTQAGEATDFGQRSLSALTTALTTLQQEQQRIQERIASSPDAFLVTDVRGIVIRATPAAARLLGSEPAQVVGRSLTTFVALSDRTRFLGRLAKVRQATGPFGNVRWHLHLQFNVVGRPPGSVPLTITAARNRPSTLHLLEWHLHGERQNGGHAHDIAAPSLAGAASGMRQPAALPPASSSAPLRLLVEAGMRLAAAPDEATTSATLVDICVPALGECGLVLRREPDGSLAVDALHHSDPYRQDTLPAAANEVLTGQRDWQPLLDALAFHQPIALRLDELEGMADPTLTALAALLRAAACRTMLIVALRSGTWHAPSDTRSSLRILVCATNGHRAYLPNDYLLATGLAQRAAMALDIISLARQADASSAWHERFVAALSHDLRTPLTHINGLVQLWQRRLERGLSVTYAKQHDVLSKIAGAADRINLQLQDLIDLTSSAQVQASGLQLQRTDMVALVAERVAAVRALAPEQILTFEHALPSVVGLWDAGRVARMVDHLLSNAGKYSAVSDPIVLHVSQITDAAGAWVELRVQDHGQGIAASDLSHFFDAYDRGSPGSRVTAAIGTSLTMVRLIAEQHSGTATIESALGEGTTITVRLPRESPANTAR